MNRMTQLINKWKVASGDRLISSEMTIKLSTYDHARIKALTELFPARNEEQILTELLSTALDEIEEAFPYIKGDVVIAEDEFGEPVYSDDGITPRFVELTKKYESSLK